MRAHYSWLALAHSLFTLAGAFSFTDSPGTQCDNIDIQWSGGVAPFQLIIIPVFGTPRNISVPTDAFNNGAGSFSAQLSIAQGRQYLLTMSDATGFGAGGYTPLRTVGPTKGGSCNADGPNVAFSFELNTALQQCRPFTFSGYSTAVQPVTAIGIVPGGTAVILRPPSGPSFDWTATAASGTSMVFMMIDAAGRHGGASDVRTVGVTDDATCLNANSPASTTSSATTTRPPPTSRPSNTRSSATSTSSASASATTTPVPTESGFSTAAIAGTVAGALVFLAVTITLGLFFLRKSRFSRSNQSHQLPSQIDLMDSNPSYHPYRDNLTPGSSPFLPAGGQYEPTPYMLSQPNPPHPQHYGHDSRVPNSSGYSQPPIGHAQYQNQAPHIDYSQPPIPETYGHSSMHGIAGGTTVAAAIAPGVVGHRPGAPSLSNTEATSTELSNRQSMASTTLTAAQRKAAMAGESTYKPPSRFILHTDAEDEFPPPNEDGVVELPPQYTERRTPSGNPPSLDHTSTLPYASPPDHHQHQ